MGKYRPSTKPSIIVIMRGELGHVKGGSTPLYYSDTQPPFLISPTLAVLATHEVKLDQGSRYIMLLIL